MLLNGTCFVQLGGGGGGGGGEQKRATKNRTPVTQGTIEPFVNNSFPTRSGKKLELEMLDLNSGLIGL